MTVSNKPKKSIIKKIGIAVLIAFVGFLTLRYFVSKDKNGIDKNVQGKEVAKQETKYQSYLTASNEAINKLTPEQKAKREEIYANLKATSTYKLLVDSIIVSMDFMPTLNAIANGILYFDKNGFSMENDIAVRVKADTDGNDKFKFVSLVCALAANTNGGVPKEIIDLFERYENSFRMANEKGVFVNADGKQSTIKYDYDLAAFFAMIDPKNPKVLDAVYDGKQKGLSKWSGTKNAIYPYLTSKAEYMAYVKQVYPESPYLLKVDFEVTANELYSIYNANEVAADEKFKGRKIAVTGIVDDISKDFTGDAKVILETGVLQTINCNFGENIKAISKLTKGTKVTIIGNCEGFIVKQVVLDNCELWD
jgi:hypothetical protein